MFLTRDPLGFVDGPNVYSYVRQNPWTAFDPLGLVTFMPHSDAQTMGDHMGGAQGTGGFNPYTTQLIMQEMSGGPKTTNEDLHKNRNYARKRSKEEAAYTAAQLIALVSLSTLIEIVALHEHLSEDETSSPEDSARERHEQPEQQQEQGPPTDGDAQDSPADHGYQERNRDRNADDTPLKDRRRRNQERRERPNDPLEKEERQRENEEIKRMSGMGGSDDVADSEDHEQEEDSD